MNPASAYGPREMSPAVAARTAWQRRRHAAWIDYLRTTREADAGGYDSVEQHAWAVLERRLRRNDELLAIALHNVGA